MAGPVTRRLLYSLSNPWLVNFNEPLRYQSAHEHWVRYCAAADVDATLHQLRHTHARSSSTPGVSLATIRKRLGHRNLPIAWYGSDDQFGSGGDEDAAASACTLARVGSTSTRLFGTAS